MSSKIEIQRICEYCKKQFVAKTTTTRYCSRSCNSRAYHAGITNLKVEESNKETRKIISKPFEDLKAKAFLSIEETGKLLGISRRTVHRMLKRKELNFFKAGKRTIIQRTAIDKLFSKV